MSNSTCSVENCERPRTKRTWCSTHYARWRKTGSVSRNCTSCGKEITFNNGGSQYCSTECRSCRVEGCENGIASKGFCEVHYRRVLKHGGPGKPCWGCGKDILSLTESRYCGDDCRPRCAIEGCEETVHGKGLCKPHYHSQYKGRDPHTYKKPEPIPDFYTCIVCHEDFRPWGQSRKYCSKKCAMLFKRYGNDIPPLDFECVSCGTTVKRDRFSTHGLKPNRSRCDSCATRRGLRKLYKEFYSSPKSKVDGCALCGEAVDRSLEWPHPLSKSVDHIVPISKGGTDDIENLQLAHLRCNISKHDRLLDHSQIKLAL